MNRAWVGVALSSSKGAICKQRPACLHIALTLCMHTQPHAHWWVNGCVQALGRALQRHPAMMQCGASWCDAGESCRQRCCWSRALCQRRSCRCACRWETQGGSSCIGRIDLQAGALCCNGLQCLYCVVMLTHHSPAPTPSPPPTCSPLHPLYPAVRCGKQTPAGRAARCCNRAQAGRSCLACCTAASSPRSSRCPSHSSSSSSSNVKHRTWWCHKVRF
jgi:hypothetical protein